MTQEKIRILIADDHAILRQGLRRILDSEPDMQVVGEASTGAEAVQLAEQLQPDVTLMDISMPGKNGIESMKEITRSSNCRVLILTFHLEYQVISEAVSGGAAGYLTKDSMDHELIAAIRTVIHGGTVFSANVSRLLAEAPPERAGSKPTSLEGLTSREREVFLMLAEGKSPSEVAHSLYVSPKTIHTHRLHILEKLGLRNTTELIRFALREGLIKVV